MRRPRLKRRENHAKATPCCANCQRYDLVGLDRRHVVVPVAVDWEVLDSKQRFLISVRLFCFGKESSDAIL